MTFIVVPEEVGTTTATVWVGASSKGDVRERSVRLELEGVEDPRELTQEGWRVWQTFKEEDPAGYAAADRVVHEALGRETPIVESFYYQRVELGNLTPRTSYEAKLIVDGLAPVRTKGYLRSCSLQNAANRAAESRERGDL